MPKSASLEGHDIFVEAFCLFVTSHDAYPGLRTHHFVEMVGGDRDSVARGDAIGMCRDRHGELYEAYG
jgi:hypothetical protein